MQPLSNHYVITISLRKHMYILPNYLRFIWHDKEIAFIFILVTKRPSYECVYSKSLFFQHREILILTNIVIPYTSLIFSMWLIHLTSTWKLLVVRILNAIITTKIHLTFQTFTHLLQRENFVRRLREILYFHETDN